MPHESKFFKRRFRGRRNNVTSKAIACFILIVKRGKQEESQRLINAQASKERFVKELRFFYDCSEMITDCFCEVRGGRTTSKICSSVFALSYGVDDCAVDLFCLFVQLQVTQHHHSTQ